MAPCHYRQNRSSCMSPRFLITVKWSYNNCIISNSGQNVNYYSVISKKNIRRYDYKNKIRLHCIQVFLSTIPCDSP